MKVGRLVLLAAVLLAVSVFGVQKLVTAKSSDDVKSPASEQSKQERQMSNVPKAEFRYVNGMPTLFIDGKAQPSRMTYWAYHATAVDKDSKKNLVEDCASRGGLHLFFVHAESTPITINADGTYGFDFSQLDKACSTVMSVDPEAYIIVTVPTETIEFPYDAGSTPSGDNPGLVPWNAANPDELCRDAKGSTKFQSYASGNSQAASLASEKWQMMAESLTRQMIRHVLANEVYGKRVIGYQPYSGETAEWMQWSTCDSYMNPTFVDYSPAALADYRKWCRRKYSNISALNAAWGTDYANFDMQIPTVAERNQGRTYLDPKKDQKLIDYHQYTSETITDAILRLGKAVKEETGGRSLFGAFYGYLFELTYAHRYQFAGHNATWRLLKSPYIDFLLSPSKYDHRGMGSSPGFMGVIDSVALNGKVWIDESDVRVFGCGQPVDFGTPSSVADTVTALKRHYVDTLVNRCAIQWYDFSRGWLSWEPSYLETIKKCGEIEKQVCAIDRSAVGGKHSIAVIVDEESTYHLGLWQPGSPTSDTPHVSLLDFSVGGPQYSEFNHMGVGFDIYLLSDIDKIPDTYKCYVFTFAPRVTRAQLSTINKRFKKNGNVLVWGVNTGITDGTKLDTDGSLVSKVTGLQMRLAPGLHTLSVNAKRVAGDITELLKSDVQAYGPPGGAFGPLCIPDEGVALGMLAGMPDNGLVRKQCNGWTSVYTCAPTLPRQLLRGIAKYAGINVVNTADDDVTFVSDRLVGLHIGPNPSTGGARVLHFPVANASVKELFSGDTYTTDSSGNLKVTLSGSATYLFLY